MLYFTDYDLALKWGIENYDNISLFTNKQKAYISAYTRNEFLNSRLRDGDNLPRHNEMMIECLDETLKKYSLKEDIIVYRGVDLDFFNKNGVNLKWLKKKVNKMSYMIEKHLIKNVIILDKGYLSTSLIEDIALNCKIKLKLHVHKGINALFINKFSISEQLEMLIERNCMIKTVASEIKKITFDNIKMVDYYYILVNAEVYK